MPATTASPAPAQAPASVSGWFKGLSNEAGLHHCYINVGIQLLWHLSEFREPFFAMARWHVCDGYAPSGASPPSSLSSASSGPTPPAPAPAPTRAAPAPAFGPSSSAAAAIISGAPAPSAGADEGSADNSKDAPPSAQRCVFCALQWLFSNLSFAETAVIRVDAVRRALSALDPALFRWGALGDAEEALQAVLDGVHEYAISAAMVRAKARANRGASAAPTASSLLTLTETGPSSTATDDWMARLELLAPPALVQLSPRNEPRGPPLGDILNLGLTPRSARACERSRPPPPLPAQQPRPPSQPPLPALPRSLSAASAAVCADASAAAATGTGPSCPSHAVLGLGWRDELVCSASCGVPSACAGQSGGGLGLRVYADSLLAAAHATKAEADGLAGAVEEIRDGLLAEDRRAPAPNEASPPMDHRGPLYEGGQQQQQQQQQRQQQQQYLTHYQGAYQGDQGCDIPNRSSQSSQGGYFPRGYQQAPVVHNPAPPPPIDSTRLPKAVAQVLGPQAGRTFRALRSSRAFFGEVLRRALLADSPCDSAQACNSCGASLEARRQVSSPPPVLFIPVAWSAEPSMDKLAEFFGLLPCWFDLSSAVSFTPPLAEASFDACPLAACPGAPRLQGPSAPYALTALICYFGKHYVAFVRDREGDSAWVQLNDSAVRAVGTWRSLVDLCMRGHYQPTVLCFTRIASGATATDSKLGKDR